MPTDQKSPEQQTVAALYHFTRISDPEARRQPLLDLCLSEGIRGTLLLAHEGINGTVAGPKDGINTLINHLQSWPEINDLEVKYSTATGRGFLRMYSGS